MVFMIDADPVLTAKEVAEELRCSKSQVYRLMNGEVEGLTTLPHLPLGRKKVVLRSRLEDWKRQNLSGIISSDSEMDTGRRDALNERNNACGNGTSKVQ
jgi:predicted DNA-binding transcriptional regulator AlpA